MQLEQGRDRILAGALYQGDCRPNVCGAFVSIRTYVSEESEASDGSESGRSKSRRRFKAESGPRVLPRTHVTSYGPAQACTFFVPQASPTPKSSTLCITTCCSASFIKGTNEQCFPSDGATVFSATADFAPASVGRNASTSDKMTQGEDAMLETTENATP